MKNYGRICHSKDVLTDEKVIQSIRGVVNKGGKYICNQCTNGDQSLFYKYFCHHCKSESIYCRYCIHLGKAQSCKDIYIIESRLIPSTCEYEMEFQLSEQQNFASNRIKKAVNNMESLLLHAVTGAGKTEMIFEGISVARKKRFNVAIASPRIDVVKEVYCRLQYAFKNETIDLLYEGQSLRHESTFVICTVHQLMRYKNHFHVVIIDEVDAFPLEMDNQLMGVVRKASRKESSHIYLTATPTKKLLSQFSANNIVTLPARYHGHPLPIPQFIYNNIKVKKVNHKLLNFLKRQIKNQRKTFVFFHSIEYMYSVFEVYRHYFSKIEIVSSEDCNRHHKVSNLRKGQIDIMFTTTILERGVTIRDLDVVIVRADQFSSSAIIQIAGRVGRKIESPTGEVICYHKGITKGMSYAKNEIIKMNKIGIMKGWINE